MHLIHRGIVNKNHKENLLNSFKTSFKKGYGIETDIHATKDGEFVCFHDFTLKRIHKINKSIKNLSYTEILNLTKKNPIPLLKDLLKLSKNKFDLFIEIKPLFSNKLLRKFIKLMITLSLIPLGSFLSVFNIQKRNKKKLLLKKKFSRIWLLDINDS